jgi:hypothetical protein
VRFSHIWQAFKGLSLFPVRLYVQRKARLLKYKIFCVQQTSLECAGSMWKVGFQGLLLLHTGRRTNDAFLFYAVSSKVLDAYLTFGRRIDRLKVGTHF